MLEQELFDLLEGTADAAFTVTDQGEICSWNNGAEGLFSYGGQTLSRKAVRIYFRGES